MGRFRLGTEFPSPHNYSFLLRWHARTTNKTALEMVEKSLQSMRQGGIFDYIGLGFHRYSVDERWLVPHFEKMLYDQAMLSLAYTELDNIAPYFRERNRSEMLQGCLIAHENSASLYGSDPKTYRQDII